MSYVESIQGDEISSMVLCVKIWNCEIISLFIKTQPMTIHSICITIYLWSLFYKIHNLSRFSNVNLDKISSISDSPCLRHSWSMNGVYGKGKSQTKLNQSYWISLTHSQFLLRLEILTPKFESNLFWIILCLWCLNNFCIYVKVSSV